MFVNIAGADNNIPQSFIEYDFVQSLYDVMKDDGVVVSNFHRGNNDENALVVNAKNMYTRVFGGCYVVTSRF